MAVPMTRVLDPDPEQSYRCTRCGEDVPLAGYRLLYRGTRRPLRCRACEADAAPTAYLRRYYAERFGADKRAADLAYRERHAQTIAARGRAWRAAHAEEYREYKQAWHVLNRERSNARSHARYWTHREAHNAAGRARYHALRALTADERAVEQEERARERRAAWRRLIRRLVAAECGVRPADIRRPAHRDHAALAARTLAVYLCVRGRRKRDRHPVAEIAAEYGMSEIGVKVSVALTARRLRRRRTDADGLEVYEQVRRVRAALEDVAQDTRAQVLRRQVER